MTIEDWEGCPRYIGRLFRDVRIGPSPPWLKARLTAAGMRPISNVVDVTNYTMLALGNPLHAFDFETLRGGRIVVRRARAGEEFTSLDGTLRKLDPADLVIADAEGAIAFAGIMGGLETEVTETTTSVLLEAANFEPGAILWSSERHALRTEGSNRWEKGVDPYLAPHAARLATQLIVDLAGARWTGRHRCRGRAPGAAGRPLPHRPGEPDRGDRDRRAGAKGHPRAARVRRRPGLGRADSDLAHARRDARDRPRRGGRARPRPGEDPLHAAAPERDVRAPLEGSAPAAARRGRAGRRRLLRGLHAQPRRARTRSRRRFAYRIRSRRSTASSGRRCSKASSPRPRHNVAVGNEDVALFEIARVYLPSGESSAGGALAARRRLRGRLPAGQGRGRDALRGARHRASPRAHAAAVPPSRQGRAKLEAGWLGELHPSLLEGEWGVFELDLSTLFEQVPERVEYEDVVSYPAVRQDLAFVVAEDVLAGDLVEAAREAAGPELRDAAVFDVFRGGPIPEGKKSVALHVSFQSPERTLSDEDARAIRERIVAALAEKFDAELRA